VTGGSKVLRDTFTLANLVLAALTDASRRRTAAEITILLRHDLSKIADLAICLDFLSDIADGYCNYVLGRLLTDREAIWSKVS
jgi:hypothetical protein